MAGHRLLQTQVVNVGVMMSNVWGGCYHCYLVDVDAAAAFLVAPPSAASALNLELRAVTAGVAVAAGRDAVVGYYQLCYCAGNILWLLHLEVCLPFEGWLEMDQNFDGGIVELMG